VTKPFIRCAIRKVPVEATPEEIVRQELLLRMLGPLGFPEGCIAVEKALRQMPHLALADCEIPDRRADIVCFAKGIHPDHDLFPLLLIECKAVKLTPRVINQVSGYNHYMGARFIAVANRDEVRLGWIDPETEQYTYIPYIPEYQELLKFFV